MTSGRLLVHAALALLVIAAVAVRGPAPAAAQTAPTFVSGMVDGATLTLVYSHGLDPSPPPARTDYTVTVSGSALGVDGVSSDGPRVKLTLASAVLAIDTVVVSYVPGTNPVQNWGGDRVAALTDYTVANNTALCVTGTVIANSGDHPELVVDCKVLWGMRETLEGNSNVTRWLNWSGALTLSDWRGSWSALLVTLRRGG